MLRQGTAQRQTWSGQPEGRVRDLGLGHGGPFWRRGCRGCFSLCCTQPWQRRLRTMQSYSHAAWLMCRRVSAETREQKRLRTYPVMQRGLSDGDYIIEGVFQNHSRFHSVLHLLTALSSLTSEASFLMGLFSYHKTSSH